MFTRFVCALLIFRARKFDVKYKTQETGKFIMERNSYASKSSATMDLRRENEV